MFHLEQPSVTARVRFSRVGNTVISAGVLEIIVFDIIDPISAVIAPLSSPSFPPLVMILRKMIVMVRWIWIWLEHIGRLARMSVLDTEVDGSNPGSSMLCT